MPPKPKRVLARSLSGINFLAANPPQYPNPTEEKQESLTLYIARVPGTRDVILSTMKPQRKNVTAGDVANSLYYIHLDHPSDENLALPALGKDHPSPRASAEHARETVPAAQIARKPLPPAANPAPEVLVGAEVRGLDNKPDLPVLKAGGTDTGGVGASPEANPYKPYQVNPYNPYDSVPGMPPRTMPAPIPRKPLGPRAMNVVDPPMISKPESPEEPRRSSQEVPEAQSQQFAPRSLSPAKAYIQSPLLLSPRSPSPSKAMPFTLTMIRRDTSTGHQWNVGKISSFQLAQQPLDNNPNNDPEAPPPSALQAAKQPSISISIDTSGYAKFRGFPMQYNFDPPGQESGASLPGTLGGLNAKNVGELVAASTAGGNGDGFTRQISMAYTKSWSSNFKDVLQRRGRSSSVDDPAEDHRSPPPRSSHGRHSSVASAASVDSSQQQDDATLITKPGPGLKPKGYFFQSPWEGRCEFRTGNGGRSLKCRHVPASSGAGGVNPLVLAQGLRDGQGLGAAGGRARGGSFSSVISGALPVSELRFNLPSTEVFKSRKDPKEPLSRFEKFLKLDQTAGGRRFALRQQQGEGYHNRSSTSEEEEYFDDEVEEGDGDDGLAGDLTGLGRERAGGGNKGNKAKLGKLIVHDEGLKMLDLVVAANMGIWWGAWERSF